MSTHLPTLSQYKSPRDVAIQRVLMSINIYADLSVNAWASYRQFAHEQIDMKSSYVFGITVAFVVSYQAVFTFQAGGCCRSKGDREDLGKMRASDGPQESGRGQVKHYFTLCSGCCTPWSGALYYCIHGICGQASCTILYLLFTVFVMELVTRT